MKITRARYDVLMTAYNESKLEYDRKIRAYETCGCSESKIQLGINWSAIGTVSPEETVRFADALKRAAEFAETINSLGLECDWDAKDKEITSQDKHNAAVKVIINCINNKSYGYIRDWIRHGVVKQ